MILLDSTAALSLLIWIGLGIIAVGALSVAFLVSLTRVHSPIQYEIGSFVALQRFFNAWAPLLEERGDIFVGTKAVPELIQFRKRRFKSRPNELVFRFRNAGRTKRFFDAEVRALEATAVDFKIERTKKRKAARAAIVKLEADGPFLALSAVQLCRITFDAIGVPEEAIVIHSSGELQAGIAPGLLTEIPSSRADLGRFGFSGIVLALYRFLRRR